MVLLKESIENSDLALVEECRNGNPAAFDELVRRYKDRIYAVVYRFLGQHEDAQDISQEVFMRAYRGIQGFKGHAQVYTWLYSIAGNLARNKLRDRHRKGRDRGTAIESLQNGIRDHILPRSGRTPEDSARESETREALQACLRELPEHYRMAFVLRTVDDLSYAEIADAMGCPVGTVKSRLNQARRLLKHRLTELDII